MKLAFTLCSNNYLAQAKTLGDSLLNHNPDYKFLIGLVDRKSRDIEYSSFEPHEIVEVEELGITDFENLSKKYGIIELNTCVKPFFFKYLFERYPVAGILYIDPDIMIFDSLEAIETELQKSSIVLTPHATTPIELDQFEPREDAFLNYGIFNLGFIGISRSPESEKIMNWWGERTREKGFMKPEAGLYVDQIWMNLAPLFFNSVTVLRNPGVNAAYWNLHERVFSTKGGKFFVNEVHPLIFFHFSSYSPERPETISSNQTRFSFQTRPDLVPLFNIYREKLLANRYSEMKQVPSYYTMQRKKIEENERQKITPELKSPILGFMKKNTPKFIKRPFRRIISKIDSFRS